MGSISQSQAHSGWVVPWNFYFEQTIAVAILIGIAATATNISYYVLHEEEFWVEEPPILGDVEGGKLKKSDKDCEKHLGLIGVDQVRIVSSINI